MSPTSSNATAKPNEVEPEGDVIILVMGPTGAGKSTFINVASGSDLRVSNKLRSCTDRIQFSRPFVVDSRQVVLVDTPGFDDTEKSESEILQILCDYLADTYTREPKKLLHGIIYMHRISDNRMTGTAIRNLRTYQAICGPEALPNSIIVTNMWGRVEVALGIEYETELRTKEAFFKPAIDAGAQFIRHGDTTESAHEIIRRVLKNQPKPLRLQQELIDEKKKIFQTAAGEALLQELAKLQQKYHEEYQDLERELAEAREREDEIAQAELEEEREKMEESRQELEAEKAKLLQLQLSYNEAVAQVRALSQSQTAARPANGDSPAGGEPVVPKASKRSLLSRIFAWLRRRFLGHGKSTS